MSCKKIKDILITDYLDGELDLNKKVLVERHLEVCSECKAFKEELSKFRADIFQKVKPVAPPDSLWNDIRNQLTMNENAPSLRLRGSVFFRDLLRIPRFALTFRLIGVGVLALAIIMVTNLNIERDIRLQKKDSLEYFGALVGEFEYNQSEDELSYGTLIEEYFLI